MSRLRVTLIDVGWGDSILLETEDGSGKTYYALVDSNDTATLRSSYIFLKRFVEKKGQDIPTTERLFDWVLLTHAHADHGQGLKPILKDFGARQFWYSKSNSSTVFFTDLLRFAGNSDRVEHHEAINSGKDLPNFGDVAMKVLWPMYDQIDDNENNNSVVLALRLGNVSFVLTGDAEVEVWEKIADNIPSDTLFFKVPHHGSDNGTLDSAGNTPWLDRVAVIPGQLGISSHVRPFSHPDPEVVAAFDGRGLRYYRTDRHYHVTVETDGTNISVQYSHI